jgi:hypothetical protein
LENEFRKEFGKDLEKDCRELEKISLPGKRANESLLLISHDVALVGSV